MDCHKMKQNPFEIETILVGVINKMKQPRY